MNTHNIKMKVNKRFSRDKKFNVKRFKKKCFILLLPRDSRYKFSITNHVIKQLVPAYKFETIDEDE